ncbi:Uncharacterised protein [Mycobacteroides abscessus]|uniref:hypothetical protein n=1 Tax=Mycobacteroides abscessus TaxID=36809 RepID=UPI0005DB3DA8|nr:hypothetical protein [Mycobacteroides abscessus]CPX19516.1 Uncharacterised protein [Mycobacteroides abscessus]
MNLKVQMQCDDLVRQHHGAFAQLRKDIAAMVLRAAQIWETEFPDPAEMHGQLHCTSVRGLLLQLRIARDGDGALIEGDGPQQSIFTPQAGALSTMCGQGMSVVLLDGRGGQFRVRKAPSKVIADRERLGILPPKRQRTAALEAIEGQQALDQESTDEDAEQPTPADPEQEIRDGQLTISGQFDQPRQPPQWEEGVPVQEETQVDEEPQESEAAEQIANQWQVAAADQEEPPATDEDSEEPQEDALGYDWFVLWTLSPDAYHVPEVFLAAVIGIDDGAKIVIVASAPLPKSAAPRQDQQDEQGGDFEDFGQDSQEGSGPDPA